jgi:hypothetical protein
MLGRVQELNQLYLTSFDEKKFKVNLKAQAESEKISKEAKKQVNVFKHKEGHIRGCTLNIRSLQKHIEDLKCDSVLQQHDIICIQETSFSENTKMEKYNMDGFQLRVPGEKIGRGVAIYYKDSLTETNCKWIVTDMHQILLVSFHNFDVISAYRSPQFRNKDFIKDLMNMINLNKSTVILGDMNTEANQKNLITTTLKGSGFKQFVQKPTHQGGRTLDHVYANDMQRKHVAVIHPVYYSDHDAASFSWKVGGWLQQD